MKKIASIILLLLVTAVTATAQTRRLENNPYIDQKKVHFGFSLGLNLQNLKLSPSNIETEDGELWTSQVSSYTPGFNVGVLADFYLCPHLNLRLTPTFYFGNKIVTFHEVYSGEEEKFNVKSNYINLPVEIKFSAKRINNYRPYMLLGIAPSFDVSKKNGEILRFKPYDTYLEVGLGFDLYNPYFKFIPELKFCFGLQDILDRTRDDLQDPLDYKYTESIGRTRSNMIVLTFYFE